MSARCCSALPQALWSRIRLAPGSPRDILRTGQLAAEMLDTEIVVYTGLPLLAPSAPTERGVARAVLVGADGNPRWRPFVDAVVCAPSTEDEPAPSPRLLRWSPPLPGPGNVEHGIVRLSDRWQAMATRAGLWITERDGQAPSASTRAVDAEGPAIEVGRPGEELDPSLWPELTRLFERLGGDVRSRARLYVHGTATDGGRELRAIAARHGVRTLRFTPRPASAPRPTPSTAPPPVAHPTTGAHPTPATRITAVGAPSLPPGSTTAASATGPTTEAAATGSAATAGSTPGPRPSRGTPPQLGRGPAPAPGHGPAPRPGGGMPSPGSRPAGDGQPAPGSRPVGAPRPAPGARPEPGTGPRPGAHPGPAPRPAGSTPPLPGSRPAGEGPPAPGSRPAGMSHAPGARPEPGSPPAPGTGPQPGARRGPAPRPAGGTPSPGPRPAGDGPSAPDSRPAAGTRPAPGARPEPGSPSAPDDRPVPGGPLPPGADLSQGPRLRTGPWSADGPSEPGAPRSPRAEGPAPASPTVTAPPHDDVPATPAAGTRPTDGEPSTTDPAPASGTSSAPRTGTENDSSGTGGRPPSRPANPGSGSRFGRDSWAAAGSFAVPDTSSSPDAAPPSDGDAGSGADTGSGTPAGTGTPPVPDRRSVTDPSPAAGERHVTPGTPPSGEPPRTAAPTTPDAPPEPIEEAGAEETAYAPPPPPARPPMMSVSSGSGDPDEKAPEPMATEPATEPCTEPATEPEATGEPTRREQPAEPAPDPDPRPDPVSAPPVRRRVASPLPPVPFQPGHVSTEAERSAFRVLAESVWDRHGTAVARMLTRMPALRGQEQEAARADLIALHLYLHTSQGALRHDELARALRHGDKPLLPYAACLASGLRRLPSYRGVAFRGAGAEGIDGGLAPGDLLRDPAPVCALPLAAGAPRPRGAQYAISSVTGRRVRQLTERPGAGAARDEVVFPPGTLLRVLDVREEGDAPLILLREVPLTTPNAQPEPGAGELDAADRAALDRMDEVLRGHSVAPGPFSWPELCDGPLGQAANRPVSD